MNTRRILGLLIVLAVLASVTSAGALSVTTGERSATIDVVGDDQGYLQLHDAHTGGLIQPTGDNTLTLDFTRGGAAGATLDTTFRFGDALSPVSDHAFRVRNRGPATVDLTAAYTLDAGSSDSMPGTANVEFEFHLDRGSDGSLETSITVQEGGATSTLVGVDPADTIYVTATVDTNGLDATSDLTGTLNVTAVG